MSRFEIEDIVSQDKRGIVFRAHDLERGHTVALRRFFPFGQDGGGLMEDEADAFRIAAQRLLGVSHPSLRSVFSGAVDPIDEMPYIVAEWVDGAKLDDVLAGENLDPRLIIQLLRLALEVSLSLSEILQEEAVWVETETNSIFVGSEESGKGYVFWLSPFKWLGAEDGSRKLAAIVELGEHLAGWKGKLIGDKAGHGLGGWLKWMKTNPDASLAQALESLPTFTTANETPPPPKPSFAPPVASEFAVRVKQPPSISPIFIAVCLGLVLAVGTLAYFRMSAKATIVPVLYSQQTIFPPVNDQAKSVQPESVSTTSAVPPPVASISKAKSEVNPHTPEDAEAISTSVLNEMIAKDTREKEAQRAAALAPPVVSAPPLCDFIPSDSEKIRALKANDPASVTGVVRKVRNSSSGHSLYFEFSSPLQPQEIHVVAHKNNLEGEFKVEAYNHLIGKNLRFDGIVFREPTGRHYVKITTTKKITEAK
jgi:hypothetical protein